LLAGRWRPFAASLFVYVAVTAILGRDLLGQLSTHVANDPGDPLLTAVILRWNATRIPLTDAWWQLPIFYPTRDAMAFSEHLLGLGPVASPIYWLTGDALVTYNLTTLLTFVLSAVTMYALVFRLTKSAAAAFLAGIAFGFAPYRISQLPHVQMLAAFWAPLALLGLHAFLETGKRRWLALYGASWMLQSAANGYALFFFSTLVGFWVLWFVVARRRWRALAMITIATVIALLPLAPVLYKYVTVHDRHGFVRGIDEIRSFSADVSALLCAPPNLTFWGWMRVNCRPEGELFPGVALFALFVVAILQVLGWGKAAAAAPWRVLTWVNRLLLVIAGVYAAIVIAMLILGPWRLELGPIRISATNLQKPLLVFAGSLVSALLLSPGVREAARQASTLGFYLVAAVATWLLSLGPVFTFMGTQSGFSGPFTWLMLLPGGNGLRVPARFWLMTMICMSVAAGLVVAPLLARRSKAVMSTLVVILAIGLFADGWTDRILAYPAPGPIPDAAAVRGATVLELPINDYGDIAAQYRAIVGDWRSVNGYSGYGPNYYRALLESVRYEVDDVFLPFQALGELHVVAANSAERLTALVERQPGVTIVSRTEELTQYRLPQRPAPTYKTGARLTGITLRSDCGPKVLGFALDGDEESRWVCFSDDGSSRQLVADLGNRSTVGGIVHGLGQYYSDLPIEMTIETSVDGDTWEPGRSGSALAAAIEGGIMHPGSMRILLPIPPREARYVRLTYPPRNGEYYWSIAELEILAGP
jgi:hypothetical protein